MFNRSSCLIDETDASGGGNPPHSGVSERSGLELRVREVVEEGVGYQRAVRGDTTCRRTLATSRDPERRHSSPNRQPITESEYVNVLTHGAPPYEGGAA